MPAALSKHMTFEQDGADWSEGHDAAKEPHPGLLTKPLPCGLSAAELCCFCFQVLRAHLESLPLPRFPADPGFKAPLFVTWLKPRQSGTNATSTSQLELRGCIGCLEVPSLTCRISILHQFEPCAHAFDWQVGVHGVLLNFSDSQGRRFSATYLPEVAKEHGMTREVAIRELVAKSGYAGPCQEILDFLEVTRYQTIVESVSYQDLASYGFGGLPHLNSP
ncbi:unnamed protein product [Durusdinium trenchii]|uniref:AMMECR1 domain-containing protein n=1 Tax=Durusdinium trenchii TaxID=1381693 RepID=A0ABP0INY5_9DINO